MNMDNKIVKERISRLEKLERAVFAQAKTKSTTSKLDPKKYKGATGGIRILVDNGFFDKKRSFGEICKALEGKGYHYSKQAVQTPLNNLSSTKGRLFVALTEKGRKLYAKRK